MTRNLSVNSALAVSLFLLIFSTACRHDPELITVVDPIDTSDNTPSGCDPDTIYFTQQVLPLLQSGCAQSGCHDAATHEEDVILDSYSHIMNTGGINISDPAKSKIYRQMVKTGEERMPPPPAPALTSEQLALIQKWIGQGAKNNSCIESGCDTTNIAYSTHIKTLIQNNCLGCHNGSNPGGGIGLSTYSEVKAIADNGKLYGTITHLQGYSAMPKNGNKLTDCQIKMVQIWLNQGSPNN
jgi:uncharacterized membrane protein